jgi:N-acetylmuramate 1-kinase
MISADQDAIALFLTLAGRKGCKVVPLAGDASTRSYFRIPASDGKASSILMVAPPKSGQNLGQFINVANEFREIGLRTPHILCSDLQAGFLLVEDFGDDLIARLVQNLPELEMPLYSAAVDVLIRLASYDGPTSLSLYKPLMVERSALAYQWYAAHSVGPVSKSNSAQFSELLDAALNSLVLKQSVPLHRDYHAENLVWVRSKGGAGFIGILDFQDAQTGPIGYDLVSLVFDVRRKVTQATQIAMFKKFSNEMNIPLELLERECAILGAQRNLRILGVFSRLCLHYAKPAYIGMLPAVWENLVSCLNHPSLSQLRDVVLRDLPKPTESILTQLKAKAGCIQTL